MDIPYKAGFSYYFIGLEGLLFMSLDLANYIKPELLVLCIVLYFIGVGMKKSQRIKDENIPTLLGFFGIALCLLWVLGTSPLLTTQSWFMAIFTAIVQGVLVAGGSVYCNQLIKQATK